MAKSGVGRPCIPAVGGLPLSAETPFFPAVKPKETYERTRRFFETHLWATGVDGVGRSRQFFYRVGRTLYATARGFREKDLTSRAASLSYYTVLSIVPFLAFAFSLLKGFGIT